jgi:hypothetical protein
MPAPARVARTRLASGPIAAHDKRASPSARVRYKCPARDRVRTTTSPLTHTWPGMAAASAPAAMPSAARTPIHAGPQASPAAMAPSNVSSPSGAAGLTAPGPAWASGGARAPGPAPGPARQGDPEGAGRGR